MTVPAGGKLLFNDNFTTNNQWGTEWSPDWFSPSSKMNNVVTDPANVKIANGVCTLTLKNTGDGALISTNPHGGVKPGFQFEYGLVEVRAWVPNTAWCAIWTTGQDWPTTGENDIVEVLDGGRYTSNYHSDHGTDNGPDSSLSPGWHTFWLNRTPGKNFVYWDDTLNRQYETYDEGAPHYIVINIGAEQGEESPGAQLLVDYVRVRSLR